MYISSSPISVSIALSLMAGENVDVLGQNDALDLRERVFEYGICNY